MLYAPNPQPGQDLVALAASVALNAVGEDGRVPEWVHLLPVTKGPVETYDGRGPYHVEDLRSIIQASLAWERGIPIDENHATDLRPGHEAPARGWIVALEARSDGLWGRVEWTAAGRALVADRAYRGISPVLLIDARDGRTVRLIPRASLVNVPNLRGLTALNKETSRMEAMNKIAEKLGLAADATLDQILAKIEGMIGKMSERTDEQPAAALQSALAEIGAAVGLPTGAPEAIVAAVKVKASGAGDVVALQAQVASLRSELDTLREAGKRAASEAWIDAEIRRGRVGVTAANREALVALHMSQPDQARAIVEASPVVSQGAIVPAGAPAVDQDGLLQLNAEQVDIVRKLGLDPKAYAKTLTEETR
ncbi:MAG: phage protease [Tabrizicola sp.]